MTYEPLFRAIPEPRGCGDRTPGGLYVESGLGPGGVPLEHYLVDPPLPVPEGLDLVNKPQVIEDPETGVYHLWLWIGAEWYPYCPDFLAETRRLGASRKLNPQLDLSRLTPSSRMILVHPNARNTLWQQQRPPYECSKGVAGHALEPDLHPVTIVREQQEQQEGDVQPLVPQLLPPSTNLDAPGVLMPAPTVTATEMRVATGATEGEFAGASGALPFGWRYPHIHNGPCLFKTYELMPREAAADDLPTTVAGRTWYARMTGSTTYFFEPSGESAEGLEPGVFAALPITGFALIQHPDGSVNAQAQDKLDAAGLPYYTSKR